MKISVSSFIDKIASKEYVENLRMNIDSDYDSRRALPGETRVKLTDRLLPLQFATLGIIWLVVSRYPYLNY